VLEKGRVIPLESPQPTLQTTNHLILLREVYKIAILPSYQINIIFSKIDKWKRMYQSWI